MPERFRPFPPVSCRYGAPMGRYSDLRLDPETDAPATLAVAGPAGEYDAGGACWGTGGREGPVWAVWRRGRGHEGLTYVRARSRDGAKRADLTC